MDWRLLSWGLRPGRASLPRLWLFTDTLRLADPRGSAERLPRGRAGVVLRHDAAADRVGLAADLARICRQRRLMLVIAGDVRLAARLGAGVHLRAGRWPNPLRLKRAGAADGAAHGGGQRRGRLVTSSAHSLIEMRRAARAGADVVFLSPAFPTDSHVGAPGLGAVRWLALAGRMQRRPLVAALGGIDGGTIRRLPSGRCRAVGAIGALA